LGVGDDERGDVVGVGEEVGVGPLEQPLNVHEPVDMLLNLPGLADGKQRRVERVHRQRLIVNTSSFGF
jgi:hypothetical protein